MAYDLNCTEFTAAQLSHHGDPGVDHVAEHCRRIAAYLRLLNFGLIGTKAGIVLTDCLGAISYMVGIVSATLANFSTADWSRRRGA